MAGRDPDDYDDEETPWYNRTPAVIGASVAGLAVIGILIAAVTFVSGHPVIIDADHDRDDYQHQPARHHRHRRAVLHHLVLRHDQQH
jgi:hypothetical protein